MSGTLDIANNSSWLPAGWVFDRILEKIADELSLEHPELSRLLLECRTDKIGYCDLRLLDEDKFLAITRAAVRAYTREAREGRKDFQDPKFFGGFMERFNELIELLRIDPRAQVFNG